LVPDVHSTSSGPPSAKTPVSGTPGATRNNHFSFVTPATVRRKKRPLNVEAILKSAQKVVTESPRQKTPVFTSSTETNGPAEIPATPVNSQLALGRAASTPRKSFTYSCMYGFYPFPHYQGK